MTIPSNNFPRRQVLGLAAGAALNLAMPVRAQSDFGSRPIRFVVPFAAGGSIDYFARVLGAEITRQTKAQVIVDNRPGGSGIIAAEYVKAAPPDGNTVLICNMDSHVNNVGLFRNLPYDPVRDFQPLGMLAEGTIMFMGSGGVPASTLREFVTYGLAQKNAMNFGTWGNGSYAHLVIATFARLSKLNMNAIPYKGEAPSLQDMLGGSLTCALISVLTGKALAEKGSLKPYAVTGEKRLALMPNVPTFKELGYDNPMLNRLPWFSAYAPAATPSPVVEKLNAVLRQALADPTVAKTLSEKGYEPTGSSAAEHRKELVTQIQVVTQVMRELGIRPE